MKYLRATISSETRGTLYKKDFRVQDVFSASTRSLVSKLITTGAFEPGELYAARIIPRYGQYSQVEAKLTNVTPSLFHQGEKRGWIELAFEDGPRPDVPLDFFTLEIFAVTQLLIFRSNHHLSKLDAFWMNIEQALANAGVLRYKETTQRKLYARDDEEHDFNHEELPTLSRSTSPLIELIPLENNASSFPTRSLADFHVQTAKKLYQGKLVDEPFDHTFETVENAQAGVHILITQSALEKVQDIARSYARVEQGGMLVGDIYEDAAKSGEYPYIVKIMAHIPAEETFANEVELRYTFESWQHQTNLLKQQFPDKRIVGWYHTHLDLVKRTYYTDSSRQKTYTSPLFFSQDDYFTHRQFFREKWYVAMVLDPEGNLSFFQWVGEEIKETRRFYVIENEIANEKEA